MVIVAIIICSCATLLNPEVQKVTINHSPELTVRVDTSQYFYQNREIRNVYIPKDHIKKDLYFLRCDNPIPLIINDTDTFNLRPHRSYFLFWFANLYTSYGLGILIDYNNDKSYDYPKYIYLEKTGNTVKNNRFNPIPENKLKFVLSIPTINSFRIQTDTGKQYTWSGLGISAGIEYFFKNNKYLSISLGTTLDLFSPYPDTVFNYDYYHFWGAYESSSTSYLNFSVYKTTPVIEYGIGVALSKLKWRANYLIGSTDTTEFYKQSSHRSLNIGLSSGLKLRLTPNLNIGLLYQPLFYDFYDKRYNYQHFITTELIWRF